MAENSRFQTYVATRFLDTLSESLNSSVSVKKVKLNILQDLILEGLLVTDQKMDTIVYVPKLRVDIDSVSLRNKHVELDDISFFSPDFRIEQNSDSVFNFQFILDSLNQSDSLHNQPWYLALGHVRMHNAKVHFSSPLMPLNINRDLALSELNLNINVKSLKPDSIHLDVKRLQYKDSKGYDLRHLRTEIIASRDQVLVDKFSLQTKHSDINFKDALIKGKDIFKNPENLASAEANIEFKDTKLALSDLTFLYAPFSGSDKSIDIEGKIQGMINHLNVDEFLFEINKVAYLDFSGQLLDVTHPNEMFMYANFKNLFIKAPALTAMLHELGIEKKKLFDKLNTLGNVTFKGDLTGLPGNYVAFGKFNTATGSFYTDVSLETNIENQLAFSGKLDMHDFNLSPFFKKDQLLGDVTMSIEAKGLFEDDEFQGMTLDGYVEKVDVNGYTYHNTDLRGYLGPQQFNGAFSINDSSLNLIFSGNVDFSEALPVFAFDAQIKDAHLDKLNLLTKFPNSTIDLTFKANFIGNHPDNFNGSLDVHNISYQNDKGKVELDSIVLSFSPQESVPHISLKSDIFNGDIKGDYHFGSLYHSIKEVIFDRLPSVEQKVKTKIDTTYNNFTFDYKISPIDTIAYIFDFPYFVYEGARISGRINDYKNESVLNAEIPFADVNGTLIKDFNLRFKNLGTDKIRLKADIAEIQLSNRKIENFSFNTDALHDSLSMRMVWNNNDMVTNSGRISSSVKFKKEKGGQLLAHVFMNPSSIILADSQWYIPASDILISDNRYAFNDVRIEKGNHYFNIDGVASKDPKDSINLSINEFQLAYIQKLLQPKLLTFSGILNGESTINGVLGNPLIQAGMGFENLVFNEVFIGQLDLNSEWSNSSEILEVEIENTKGTAHPLFAKGMYSPSNDSLDIDISLNKFSVQILRPFIKNILHHASGFASGKLELLGKLSKPYFDGTLLVENGSTEIEYLKTTYSFSDSVRLAEKNLYFDHITIYDKDGNEGTLNGTVMHNGYKDIGVDLSVSTKKLMVLNTKERDNDLYYGTIYAGGYLTVKGAHQVFDLDANVTTGPNSTLFLPINSASTAEDNNFISYVNTPVKVQKEKTYRKVKETQNTNQSLFTVRLGVNATPDGSVELIFDETVGDIIKGQGNGLLNFEYVSTGDFSMNGEYTISKGDYLFTMLNLINKSFSLEPGGTIRWNGDPFEAIIDLDAYYQLRAPLYDLMPTAPNAEELKKRFPVQCHMMLTNNLMRPNIKFDIVLPTANEETKRSVESVINTEDELNRQVISLLAMNRFYTPDYLRNETDNQQNNTGQAAAVTASEFLSSQLSNWLSQINKDVDLGVHYRPGDNTYTSTEVELVLGTQFWDDRIEFNGNVGIRDDKNNPNAGTGTSTFVGDFEVFVKLNQNYRLKAYSRTNDNIFYETSPTTQGIGVIYKEDFNDFVDLKRTRKKRKEDRKDRKKEKKAKKGEMKVYDVLMPSNNANEITPNDTVQ